MPNNNPRITLNQAYVDGGCVDPVAVTTVSDGSGGRGKIAEGAGAAASAVWPTANKAIFIPFVISGDDRPSRVYSKIILMNGAAVSGNVDVGVYDANGNKLVSAGSTAQAGTTQPQVFTFASPLQLTPGRYYLGIALDNGVGTTARLATTLQVLRAMGVRVRTTSFPLPASVSSWTGCDVAYLPLVSLVEGSWA